MRGTPPNPASSCGTQGPVLGALSGEPESRGGRCPQRRACAQQDGAAPTYPCRAAPGPHAAQRPRKGNRTVLRVTSHTNPSGAEHGQTDRQAGLCLPLGRAELPSSLLQGWLHSTHTGAAPGWPRRPRPGRHDRGPRALWIPGAPGDGVSATATRRWQCGGTRVCPGTDGSGQSGTSTGQPPPRRAP